MQGGFYILSILQEYNNLFFSIFIHLIIYSKGSLEAENPVLCPKAGHYLFSIGF